MLPTGVALVAVVVAVAALRAVGAEAERLTSALRTMPVLADQGRQVRGASDRAAAAQRSTGDALARRALQ